KVASEETSALQVFGGDYDTEDGSCIRDFIHVMDLAKGHVKALNYMATHEGCEAFNLGTGIGYSVFDLIRTFEDVNNVKVPHTIVARREGDIVASIADVSKAKILLDWNAQYDLLDMCYDSWKWYKNVLHSRVDK
ncbi:MAG: GDP-mannose 4,6-dehydratase, partial [Lysinibacillus sp.]